MRAWLAGFLTVASSLLWCAAVSRVPLSFAFPIAAMSYPIIMIGSAIFSRRDNSSEVSW
jgi:drug/metabolite transporter (DMT)-like permease